MITPRYYISYSQLMLVEKSEEQYVLQYIRGLKPKSNINMKFGELMANALEKDEGTSDPILDLMIAQLPKFANRDIPFEAKLKDGKEEIILLAKPDSWKPDGSAFLEYKTSVRDWKQKMVDESDQITFYATAFYLAFGKIPEDIELVQVKTAYRGNKGVVVATGEILRFPTKRKLLDIIKMSSRIKKGWKKIKEICEKELL